MVALLGNGVALAQSAPDEDQPPDSVIEAALEAAAGQLQVSTDRLVVVATEARDWPDSSLGCPEPGHAYAQIVTPGWLITIDTDDAADEVMVHSTRVGDRVVIC